MSSRFPANRELLCILVRNEDAIFQIAKTRLLSWDVSERVDLNGCAATLYCLANETYSIVELKKMCDSYSTPPSDRVEVWVFMDSSVGTAKFVIKSPLKRKEELRLTWYVSVQV